MVTRREVLWGALMTAIPGVAEAGCGCGTVSIMPFGAKPLPASSPHWARARALLNKSPDDDAFAVAQYLSEIEWLYRHEWTESAYANPLIVDLFTDLGLRTEGDTTSWCAAFMNWCLARAGIRGTDCAWAQSFATWGDPVWVAGHDPAGLADAGAGDVAVFRQRASPCQGHVAFFQDMPNPGTVTILGGNQFIIVDGRKVYAIDSKPLAIAAGSEFELLGIRRAP